jgi:hypothetical protein
MEKKILFLLFIFSSFLVEGANQGNNPLKDVLKKIERNTPYKLIGCIIDQENIDGENLFVKKAAIEFKKKTIFITSYPFKDENLIVYQEIVIYNKITDEQEIIGTKRNKSIDSFLKRIPLKEFLDKDGNRIVCGLSD